jgi:hypothetical protein
MFGASTVTLIFFTLLFLFLNIETERKDKLKILSTTIASFRSIFILCYIIFGTGIAVHVFHHWGINYMYIFELDPHHKMAHFQLYKVSLVLFFLLNFFYSLNVIQYTVPKGITWDQPWFLLILCILIIAYCFQPFFRCGYRTARF